MHRPVAYQIAPRMHFCHVKTITQQKKEQMLFLFCLKICFKTIFAKDRDTDVTRGIQRLTKENSQEIC